MKDNVKHHHLRGTTCFELLNKYVLILMYTLNWLNEMWIERCRSNNDYASIVCS